MGEQVPVAESDGPGDEDTVGGEQVRPAVGTWRRLGEGRHPAALNLGDRFADALARARVASVL